MGVQVPLFALPYPILFFSVALLLSLLFSLLSVLLSVVIGPSMVLIFDGGGQDIIELSSLVGSHFASIFVYFQWLPERLRLSDWMLWLPTVLAMIALARWVLAISQHLLWERYAESYVFGMRQSLFSSYASAPRSFVSQPQNLSEELTSLISMDTRLIKELMAKFYGALVKDGVQILFLTATLFLLSLRMSMFFLVVVAPMVVVVQRLGKKMRRRAQAVLEDFSGMSEWLQQRLMGIETIKQFRSEALEQKSFVGLLQRLLKRQKAAARVKARASPLVEGIGFLAFAAVLAFALREISMGRSTGAMQMSFFATLALLSQSVGRLSKQMSFLYEGRAAWQRLENFSTSLITSAQGASIAPMQSVVQTQPLVDDGPSPTLMRCHQVCAAFSSDIVVIDDQQTFKGIHNFDFEFKAGRIYCLCGPSGAGKSTLFKLFLGLRKPQQGQIYLHPSLVKKGMGYVPQQLKMRPGSLVSNLFYPDEDGDTKKALELLQSVGIEKDPDDPQLWSQLSGGQIQRVLMARVLYHQYPLVLVDEGTSALDQSNEDFILKMLRTWAEQGLCVITIAHRRAVLEASDEFIYLKEGRIVQSGLVTATSVEDLFKLSGK